jgi:hypothetical protein
MVGLAAVMVGVQPAGAAGPRLGVIEGLFDVGGYRLYLRCTGKGNPTVVMDTSAGDDSRLVVAHLPAEVGHRPSPRHPVGRLPAVGGGPIGSSPSGPRVGSGRAVGRRGSDEAAGGGGQSEQRRSGGSDGGRARGP